MHGDDIEVRAWAQGNLRLVAVNNLSTTHSSTSKMVQPTTKNLWVAASDGDLARVQVICRWCCLGHVLTLLLVLPRHPHVFLDLC